MEECSFLKTHREEHGAKTGLYNAWKRVVEIAGNEEANNEGRSKANGRASDGQATAKHDTTSKWPTCEEYWSTSPHPE